MNDLISRQAAVDALYHHFPNKSREDCAVILHEVPSAEPERGEWEERYLAEEAPLFRRRFVCSACGHWNTYGKTAFCPDCGAKMEVDDETN